MELIIDVPDKEEVVAEALANAGVEARMDPDITNVFYIAEGVDPSIVERAMEAAGVPYQWSPNSDANSEVSAD